MGVRPADPGITEFVPGQSYGFEVYGNNYGLGGDPTAGVNWVFEMDPGLNYVSSSSPDPADDFFQGVDLFWDEVLGPGEQSLRVSISDSAPGDTEGVFGNYVLEIPGNISPGSYEVGLSGTTMANPNAQAQPHEVHPFYVRIVPEPGSLGLLGLGSVALMKRRRE
jgi:hypothetical protein